MGLDLRKAVRYVDIVVNWTYCDQRQHKAAMRRLACGQLTISREGVRSMKRTYREEDWI